MAEQTNVNYANVMDMQRNAILIPPSTWKRMERWAVSVNVCIILKDLDVISANLGFIEI